MRRQLLAALVVAHGLAHASIATWGISAARGWFLALLWSLSLVGYVAAGFGMLRLPLLRDWWKQTMVVATAASMLLLVLVGQWIGVAGAVVDLALLLLVFEWVQPTVDADVHMAEAEGTSRLPHPRLHRAGWGAATLVLAYLVAVVALRPAGVAWGTTEAERQAALPGDELVPEARHRVEQAITIHAPADSVWLWVTRIAQERAGFGGYDRVERVLGVRLGSLSWRVAQVVPHRALVLEEWGTFAVLPVDSFSTRLMVRTRCACAPTVAGLLAGPVRVLVLEPAQIVMQRRMLVDVREGAEGSMRHEPRLAGGPLSFGATYQLGTLPLP